MSSTLTKRLYAVRYRLIETMPTKPQRGYLPQDEFVARTVEEQQLIYKLFWDPATHTFDRKDHYRISPYGRAKVNPKGNVAVIGIFFYSPRTKFHLFEVKRVLNPLSCSITRMQWRIILAPLILRDAYWCWLPGICDAYEDDSWRIQTCIGWSCHFQKFYKPSEYDYVLGPDVCAIRRDVEEETWIGTSLLKDISSTRSGPKS
jgi:hypothetical protein